jgi:hypothetical protein
VHGRFFVGYARYITVESFGEEVYADIAAVGSGLKALYQFVFPEAGTTIGMYQHHVVRALWFDSR